MHNKEIYRKTYFSVQTGEKLFTLIKLDISYVYQRHTAAMEEYPNVFKNLLKQDDISYEKGMRMEKKIDGIIGVRFDKVKCEDLT